MIFGQIEKCEEDYWNKGIYVILGKLSFFKNLEFLTKKCKKGIDASTGTDNSSTGTGFKLPAGPITRTRAKKIKSVFQGFVGQFIEERLGGPTLKKIGRAHV